MSGLEKYGSVKDLFPKKKGIDYNKLEISREGIYSITKPKEAEKISRYIKENFPFVNRIVDGTASVGGNVISFCENFDYVLAIEKNNTTFKMLVNNIVDVYGYKNCNIVNNDLVSEEVLNYIKKNNYDLLFIDPPWGGMDYKKEFILKLGLGEKEKYKPLWSIVNEILKNEIVSTIVLKLPYNYDYFNLIKKNPDTEIKITTPGSRSWRLVLISK